jgi:hypothetical protein
MMVKKLHSVKPIPTRNWKNKNFDLVVERDKNRKKSQQIVDERIHYLWFHYLKLCLNLEDLKYKIQKKGGRGKVLEETRLKVKKSIYKKWDLNEVSNMTFGEWYKDEKHRLLFTEGGFKHTRGSQYHSLVKRYNVFIEYFNGRTGDYDKDMNLCEDIIKKYQKERFDQIKRDDPRSNNLKPFNSIIHKDFKDCEKTLLSVCQGQFPKSNGEKEYQ